METNPYQAPRANEILPEESAGALDDWVDAGLGRRWVAYVIDQFIMVGAAIGLMIVVEVAFNSGMDANLLDAIPDQVLGLFIAAVSVVVYGPMEGSSWHATLGKKLLGLQVIRSDGAYPTMQEAMVRNAAKWIGLSICGLLAFSVLGNDRSAVWDKPSKTRVVRKNPYAS